MSCDVFTKDPGGTRRVIVDFSDWLGSSEISSAAWTVPNGITAANSSETTTTATNYFYGGAEGQEYTIKVCITTNETVARVKCVSFLLRVESDCA